jgi:hypothetical protein
VTESYIDRCLHRLFEACSIASRKSAHQGHLKTKYEAQLEICMVGQANRTSEMHIIAIAVNGSESSSSNEESGSRDDREFNLDPACFDSSGTEIPDLPMPS